MGVIVKHVALARMRYTPCVFMRAKISGFAKIGRTRIVGWDQVICFNQDSVRNTVMSMAAVVVGV